MPKPKGKVKPPKVEADDDEEEMPKPKPKAKGKPKKVVDDEIDSAACSLRCRDSIPASSFEQGSLAMAIVSCPECGKKLKIADTSVGKKVKGPCGHVFVADGDSPAPAAVKPAPPSLPKKIYVACTECESKLKVATTSLGKKMKCPKCSAVFVANLPDDVPVKKAPPPPAPEPDEDEAPAPRPRRSPPKSAMTTWTTSQFRPGRRRGEGRVAGGRRRRPVQERAGQVAFETPHG